MEGTAWAVLQDAFGNASMLQETFSDEDVKLREFQSLLCYRLREIVSVVFLSFFSCSIRIKTFMVFKDCLHIVQNI